MKRSTVFGALVPLSLMMGCHFTIRGGDASTDGAQDVARDRVDANASDGDITDDGSVDVSMDAGFDAGMDAIDDLTADVTVDAGSDALDSADATDGANDTALDVPLDTIADAGFAPDPRCVGATMLSLPTTSSFTLTEADRTTLCDGTSALVQFVRVHPLDYFGASAVVTGAGVQVFAMQSDCSIGLCRSMPSGRVLAVPGTADDTVFLAVASQTPTTASVRFSLTSSTSTTDECLNASVLTSSTTQSINSPTIRSTASICGSATRSVFYTRFQIPPHNTLTATVLNGSGTLGMYDACGSSVCIGTSNAGQTSTTFTNAGSQPHTVTLALAPSDTSGSNIHIATDFQLVPTP